jgi:3-hydroxyacyl-CoA dehydrogenase
MFYADRVGLGAIRDSLETFAKESGEDSLKPAQLLARLAAEGKGFAR